MPNGLFKQRLISNTTDVYLGIDREQAAYNAANEMGSHPNTVPRYPLWPAVQKYMNDTVPAGSPSPFANVPNPEYIWDGTPTPGQTVAMAVASDVIEGYGEMVVFLAAFADNAMEAKVELFMQVDGEFVPVTPQPSGLDDFVLVAGTPNNPATGLTETLPYNWQDVRVYSTDFYLGGSTNGPIYKVVVSFEVTNYLTPPAGTSNPAALQFIADLYQTQSYV